MKKMKIWAHRGASGYAPENTMEAFSEAVRRKADGIELDVQRLWETSGCGCASSYICAFAASRFSGTVQGGEAASACVNCEYKRTLPADAEGRRECCDHQFSGYTILVIVWRKALWKAK